MRRRRDVAWAQLGPTGISKRKLLASCAVDGHSMRHVFAANLEHVRTVVPETCNCSVVSCTR